MLEPRYLNPTLSSQKTRRYILKNHIFLEDRLIWTYMQGLTISGNKPKAEKTLIRALSLLQQIQTPTKSLYISAKNLMEIVEISPIRTGKKVRMLARPSSAARQLKRSPQLLVRRLRAHRFIGQSFLKKFLKEIYASLYYPSDSERRHIHKLIFTAGYLNLRYLRRRWY